MTLYKNRNTFMLHLCKKTEIFQKYNFWNTSVFTFYFQIAFLRFNSVLLSCSMQVLAGETCTAYTFLL